MKTIVLVSIFIATAALILATFSFQGSSRVETHQIKSPLYAYHQGQTARRQLQYLSKYMKEPY